MPYVSLCFVVAEVKVVLGAEVGLVVCVAVVGVVVIGVVGGVVVEVWVVVEAGVVAVVDLSVVVGVVVGVVGGVGVGVVGERCCLLMPRGHPSLAEAFFSSRGASRSVLLPIVVCARLTMGLFLASLLFCACSFCGQSPP